MRAASSIWSRYVNRLFGSTRPSKSARPRRADLRRRELAPVYCAAQVMEERALLSASFDGVLTIANPTGFTTATDVAADGAGNSYMAGWFNGTVDFDAAAAHGGDTDILTARGDKDIYVAKYAPDNSLIWVQRMGGDTDAGTTADYGGKIALDGAGNVYVAGAFRDSADFGTTTLVSSGGNDGFVVKLDAGGTVQWAGSWGTSGFNESGAGVGVDSTGNVYALGRGTDFHSYDFLKFNSTGNQVWSRSINTNLSISITDDLAVDAAGNVFAVGSFSGTVDFDPGPRQVKVTGAGQYGSSAFAMKLTTNGSFAWVAPFVGQNGWARSESLALDGSGNVIVSGDYQNYGSTGKVDFNPGKGVTNLSGAQGAYIAKLNSSGGLVWARGLETDSGTIPMGLATDSAGSIYVAGRFTGTTDFDPGTGVQLRTNSGTGGNGFVLKLTATGNFTWVETWGAGANAIAVDPTGGIHLVGGFTGTVDFDPDPFATYYLTTPGTYGNAFRLRLRQV